MRNRVLVGVVLIATTRLAMATPWGERCKARLAKVTPALTSIGKVTIAIAPAPASKQRSGQLKDTDAFGALSVRIAAGARTYTATIGADHSGHRYRGRRGLESTRFEVWHSPYEDSENGAPPDVAAQPVREEFHHAVDVGVVRAELRVDVAGVKPKRPTPPATDDQSPPGPRPVLDGLDGVDRIPTYTGDDQKFAAALRPVLEACWTDVLPDEADESLAWTTTCLRDLTTAQAALVKLDPIFTTGTCAREPFASSCGHDGAEPKWNALTSTGGGEAKAKLAWTDDGDRRTSYAADTGLIWSSAQLTTAQFALLRAAFARPLERCAKLLRTNMYVP
ncbi:MAG: hypothetical protein NT062_20410 [Proteobacteria bacterium]|nr:hypothetical protein [Pseudomonadota bacterium]